MALHCFNLENIGPEGGKTQIQKGLLHRTQCSVLFHSCQSKMREISLIFNEITGTSFWCWMEVARPVTDSKCQPVTAAAAQQSMC